MKTGLFVPVTALFFLLVGGVTDLYLSVSRDTFLPSRRTIEKGIAFPEGRKSVNIMVWRGEKANPVDGPIED